MELQEIIKSHETQISELRGDNYKLKLGRRVEVNEMKDMIVNLSEESKTLSEMNRRLSFSLV